MRARFEFYATIRDPVGENAVERTLPDDATVGDAIRVIAEEYDGLEALLFRANGNLRPNVAVTVDDNPVDEHAVDERLPDEATVVLAPGVAGGAETHGSWSNERETECVTTVGGLR